MAKTHSQKLKPLIYKIYVELGRLKHEETKQKSVMHFHEIYKAAELLAEEGYTIQRNAQQLVEEMDRLGFHQ